MGKLIDLVGQRFGFWVVQQRGTNSKNGQVRWICKCECGKEKSVTTNSLRSGNSTSCGCNHTPDLVGEKFGKLTVKLLDITSINKDGRRTWLCGCECGKEIIISTYKLRENIITCCGCSKLPNMTKQINLSKDLVSRGQKLMQRNLELMQNQTRIMALFNDEMRRSVDLLSTLKKTMEQTDELLENNPLKSS